MSGTKLGSLIAQGRTADIHAWGDDGSTVVKLYHDWFQSASIDNELYRSQQVQGIDFPLPWAGERVEVFGRNGITFQRIHGHSMLATLRENPQHAATYAARLADLQLQLHAIDAQPNIPILHNKLKGKILDAAALSADLKSALITGLAQMPVGHSICHGDFHPGNIVTTVDGEIVVDWIDCAFGNPIADVARTTILFRGGITGNETPDPQLEAMLLDCHEHYLARYFSLSVGAEAEYARWLPIIAGARLNEGIASLEPWLLSEASKIFDKN